MKLRETLFAVAAAVLAAPAAAQQVTFMTGPQGGSWIPLGGALKGMWEKSIPGLQITQVPGAGIANVRGVDEGKAQIGFANSSTTVDGLEGRPPYPKKVTKVCQVANLYPQYFQVVALKDANIKSFADTSVSGGQTYTYYVRAWNSVGFSGNSNEAAATPLSIPIAPNGLSAAALATV